MRMKIKSMKKGNYNSPLRYVEFCAGVGGFRLGIEASSLNAKIVHANEIDESCARTYNKNFD